MNNRSKQRFINLERIETLVRDGDLYHGFNSGNLKSYLGDVLKKLRLYQICKEKGIEEVVLVILKIDSDKHFLVLMSPGPLFYRGNKKDCEIIETFQLINKASEKIFRPSLRKKAVLDAMEIALSGLSSSSRPIRMS